MPMLRDIRSLDRADLRQFLVEREWADPQFVKLVYFNKLDGAQFLDLTKANLREDYDITELGVIKRILREIRALQGQEPLTELTATDFSQLDDSVCKIATPSPRFNGSTTPLSCSPRPIVGQEHKRVQRNKQGQPNPNKLVTSFSLHTPPTVLSMEEYHQYRATSPNNSVSRPHPPAGARPKKATPTTARRQVTPQQAQSSLESEATFKSDLEQQISKAWMLTDRENRGWVRHLKLEVLFKKMFPKFGPKIIADYTNTVLEYCDPHRSGKIFREDFMEAIMNKLVLVRKAFMMVDTDGTGEIDYLELERLLHQVFPTYSKREKQKYQAAIIAECDQSGEGKISLQEFITSEYANLLAEPAELEIRKQDRLEKVRELFARVDSDNSGKLSHAELKALILSVFPDYSVRQQDAFFEVVLGECDKDNSGSIDLEEFCASDYANVMLSTAYPDFQAPPPRSPRRPRINDRDKWEEEERKTTRSQSLKDCQSLHITTMGSTSVTEEQMSASEAAALSRKQREENKRKVDEATMSASRKTARERAMQLAEQEQWEKMQEAREVLRQGARMQSIGYVPGILEKERRLAYIEDIFSKWDESSDVSRSGSGFIEYFELRSVLQRFFNWTDAEADNNADALMKQLDKDCSGYLDFEEFVAFITGLTKRVQPKHFDTLMEFLWCAIADFSKAQEHDRRIKLLTELFFEWDYNQSGDVDQRELCRVLTRFNDMERDGGEEHFVELMFTGADENNDGSLDVNEFVNFFDDLTFKLTPGEFDFMIYRLHRCLDEVLVLLEESVASLKYKQVLLNALEGYEIDIMLKDSKPFMPMICYGTACDPARAIEQYAEAKKTPTKAFLVTHDKAEMTAIEGIQKWGYTLGHWILIVLGKDYEADTFLRNLGISLQTQTSIAPRFRLWVHAPYGDIKDFPAVFLCNARLESLDEIDPEDRGLSREVLDWKRHQQVGKLVIEK